MIFVIIQFWWTSCAGHRISFWQHLFISGDKAGYKLAFMYDGGNILIYTFMNVYHDDLQPLDLGFKKSLEN